MVHGIVTLMAWVFTYVLFAWCINSIIAFLFMCLFFSLTLQHCGYHFLYCTSCINNLYVKSWQYFVKISWQICNSSILRVVSFGLTVVFFLYIETFQARFSNTSLSQNIFFRQNEWSNWIGWAYWSAFNVHNDMFCHPCLWYLWSYHDDGRHVTFAFTVRLSGLLLTKWLPMSLE